MRPTPVGDCYQGWVRRCDGRGVGHAPSRARRVLSLVPLMHEQYALSLICCLVPELHTRWALVTG